MCHLQFLPVFSLSLSLSPLHDTEHLHLLFQITKNNLPAVLLSDKDPLVSPVSCSSCGTYCTSGFD